MEADCKALITNLRDTPTGSGYRPAHLIKDDYFTTGVHTYYDRDILEPGNSCLGEITFITPEAYPESLYNGKIIDVYEASRMVGKVEIIEVYNDILKK